MHGTFNSTRRWSALPLGWGALVACAASCFAQPEAREDRPDAAGRLVRVFDFEEEDSNPNVVPRYWTRVYDTPKPGTRPQLPPWNKAEILYKSQGAITHNGTGAVRLPTGGGDVRLALDPGVIPIFPHADYMISAFVRTERLQHARARVVARFLDRESKPIADSERHTPAIISPGEWTPIRAELVGDYPNAAFIQLDLELLQPQPHKTADGRLKAPPQDYNGEAWFDDLLILQLPRVALETNSPVNLITAPDSPELQVTVRDLTGERLLARLQVFDDLGTLIDQHQLDVGRGLSEVKWTPSLPRYGWYRAALNISAAAGAVGGARVDFLWLAPHASAASAVRGSIPDRARFGLIAGATGAKSLRLLPEVTRAIGTGSIALSIWDATPAPEEPAARFPTIDALLDDWQDVTLVLERLPALLAASQKLERDDALTFLARDPSLWQPFLAPYTDRYGQRISRFQVGAQDDDHIFWRPSSTQDALAFARALSKSVAGPIVVLPLRADRGRSTNDHPDALAFASLIPDAVSPTGARELAASVRRSTSPPSPPDASLIIQPLRSDVVGPRAAAIDLAKRAVQCWASSGAPTDDPLPIFVDRPWEFVGDRRPQFMPDASLAAWRTVIQRLAGRRVVANFPVSEGVTAYILAPSTPTSTTGAIVAWNDSAPRELAVIDAYLGPASLSLIDAFGNTSSPTPSPTSTTPGSVRIPLTQEPLFIEGVDTELARLIANLRFEPDLIESSQTPQEHSVVISNPWNFPIAGRVSLLEPGAAASDGATGSNREHRWRVFPRHARIAIPPFQSARFPFTISLGPSEETGPKQLTIRLELSTGVDYPPIEVKRFATVGHNTLRMDLTSSIQDPDTLVIDAAITNTGTQELDLNLVAFAPGRPRSPASISRLPAGNQAIRRFVFPHSAAQLSGQRIIVGATVPETGIYLNSSVLIP